MSNAEELVNELETTRKFFSKTLSTFEETDAGFSPKSELYTVAGHVAHVADTVDWFVEGAFGPGWNMDFEGLIANAKAVESLDDAIPWLDRAFENAVSVIGSASPEALSEPIPDSRIMDGAPRRAIVAAITDHTAHHRGALAVYARLLGKVPPMPYG